MSLIGSPGTPYVRGRLVLGLVPYPPSLQEAISGNGKHTFKVPQSRKSREARLKNRWPKKETRDRKDLVVNATQAACTLAAARRGGAREACGTHVQRVLVAGVCGRHRRVRLPGAFTGLWLVLVHRDVRARRQVHDDVPRVPVVEQDVPRILPASLHRHVLDGNHHLRLL